MSEVVSSPIWWYIKTGRAASRAGSKAMHRSKAENSRQAARTHFHLGARTREKKERMRTS